MLGHYFSAGAIPGPVVIAGVLPAPLESSRPLGSIEIGKLADLAVLSDDPLSVSDDKLKRLRSVLTLQAGRIVHGEDD